MDKYDPKAGKEAACPDAEDAGADTADDDRGDAEPDTFELKLDGQVHTLPAALKGAFLRQADYTRKTQELAEHRRALDAERTQVAQLAQAHANASNDRVQLAALDHQLAGLHGVDWRAFGQQDPQGAQALYRKFQGLAQARDQLAGAVAQHEHGRKLQAAREAAQAMAETGRTLAKEIEGWSPELAGKLTDYARGHGVTLEELQNASDPRVWKILHKAYVADQAGQRDAAAKAQAVRPAVSVAGSAAGGGGVRDELATKEWMRRRNDQLRKGR
jgi:hypothetical protein